MALRGCLAPLVAAFCLLPVSALAQAGSCGLPVSLQASPQPSDALFVLRAASGLTSCAPSVCDVGGDGLDEEDVRRVLSAAVSPAAALACAQAGDELCGQPITTAAVPSPFDARFVLAAAAAIRPCDTSVCDVNANYVVSAVDAQLVNAAAAGMQNALQCPVPDGGPRLVPGQSPCASAVELNQCRLRVRKNGPRDRLRLVCNASVQGGFSNGFEPGTEELIVDLKDTGGPCFSSTMPAGSCESRTVGYVCRRSSSLGGLSLVRIRLRPSSPDEFRLIARATDTDLSCLDRLSSPWTVGVTVGDDCGETGCPVVGRALSCPGTCGNGTVELGEQCDGAGESPVCDDDCSYPVCGDGTLNASAGEECDDGGPTAECTSSCTTTGSVCGDGSVDAGEQCDGGNLDGESCVSLGFSGGTLGCAPTCLFDTGGCSVCGNDVIEAGEQCDGSDLDGQTCVSRGFTSGTLGCSGSCAFDTSGCSGTPSGPGCAITFGIPQTAMIGALSFEVGYASAPGDFRGSGSGVQCVSLRGDFSAYNDCDTPGGCPPLSYRQLAAATISVNGFATPADVTRCTFDGTAVPTSSDFSIVVTDASDPNFLPVAVTVGVTDISCTGTPPPTVTTSSTVITTPTTTTTVTTVTMPMGTRHAIQLLLDDTAGVSVGALGFVVDYSSAPGGFVGSGADIASGGTLQCTKSAGDFASFNDDDTGSLNAAFVSLAGFQGPTQVAICNFEQSGISPPVAGNFVITTTDASQPNLNPISPRPGVSVGSITPLP